MNNQKIKVLELIATLEIGGAERQLLGLVKNINKAKYNITVCCLTRGGRLLEEMRKTGVEVVILDKKFKYDFSVVPKLVKLLKRKKIDIVHTWMFTSNSFGRFAAIIAGIPIIVASERNVDIWKGWHHRAIDRLFSFFTDKIVANSRAVEDFLTEKESIASEKITVIYNGIDLNEVSKMNSNEKALKEKIGIKNDPYIVSNVGNLKLQKGFEFYIKAAKSVLEKAKNIVFLIVGEGKERERLEKLTRKLKIEDKIIFTGQWPDAREIIKISDLIVSSSLWEGHPNVILEAMVFGKPVVATRVGGTQETAIDGKTGILVPPKNPDALANGIVSVLNNKKIAEEMGSVAKHTVEENFTVNKTVIQTEELYNSLIGKARFKD